MSVIIATIGSLYASGSVHQTFGPGRWVVIVSIYLFSIAYCMSESLFPFLRDVPFEHYLCISLAWALGIKVYASEIQPVPTRATATSLAQSANCASNPSVHTSSTSYSFYRPRIVMFCYTRLIYSDLADKLLRRSYHPRFTRKVIFRILLPLLRMYYRDCCSVRTVHARNERSST